jgi:hypothetical protein
MASVQEVLESTLIEACNLDRLEDAFGASYI